MLGGARGRLTLRQGALEWALIVAVVGWGLFYYGLLWFLDM